MDINYMTSEELAEMLGLSVEEIEQMDEEQREAEEFFGSVASVEEAGSNMPCDFSGYCVGTSCPRFFECQ